MHDFTFKNNVLERVFSIKPTVIAHLSRPVYLRAAIRNARPEIVKICKKTYHFFEIVVTSLIFDIFAPDFFKPTLLGLESSKISKILPEIKNGPSYPPSEVVVSPKSGVQNPLWTTGTIEIAQYCPHP